MALPIRYKDFPDPGQSITIRLLAEAADDSFLLSGRDGGQVGYGSPVSGEDLELHSNPSEDGLLTIGVLVVDEATGRVGIGTASPSRTLELSEPGGPTLRMIDPTSGKSWHVGPNASNRFVINEQTSSATAELACDPGFVYLVPGGGGGVAMFGTGSFGSGVDVVFIGNSTTSPSGNPSNGVLVEAKDVNAKSELFVHDEQGQRRRLTGVAAVTTSDFTKTADTTLADITGLDVDLEAGKTYRFVIRIPHLVDTTGGYKVQLSGTCTATHVVAHWYRLEDSGGITLSKQVLALGHSAVGEASPAAADGLIKCEGTIVVNAAGTLTAKFAQMSASGSSTSYRGSTIEIEEI